MAKTLKKTFRTSEIARVMELKLDMPVLEVTEKTQKKSLDFLKDCFELKSELNSQSAKTLLSKITKQTAILIEEYEKTKYPTKDIAPAQILQSFMNDHGLKQIDLKKEFGSQSIVSDVLKGNKNITISAAKKLGRRFSVSPTLFLDL
ncbi:MAG: hypothetical protein CL677_00370 [Bdellovibrionaceae bacterium]|jgi:antitoxin component HigA of HigAB toxin-antitoxin module|nr:hypothetical protein [Pseudobdellovibrionaceae bacterium]|tara:strand:+ start:3859 stop:4299 length:441 start_codon:yes stop_codon:yes gene_type:complete